MPFRSEKQRRYLWKNHPKIARDWTDEHGSKPQPKKKAEGGSVKKVQDRLSVQDIKRAEKATEEFSRSKSPTDIVYEKLQKEGGRLTKPQIEQLRNALRGTKEARKIIKKKPELVGPEKGTKQAKVNAALEKYKNLTDKQRTVLGLPPREKKEDYPSYLKGKEKAKEHREKLKKLLRKGTGYVEGWLGKKQGGMSSAKKRKKWEGYNPETDQPRPRPNPFGKKGKEKHHLKAGGIARRPKRDTKHNPHMEPYRGSYISGKVDGKMLSNPSLRKYYKGLI